MCDTNTENINSDFNCYYCLKLYSTKGNLVKYLKICKAKKENDDEKENIFKLLLKKDKENKNKITQLEEQNKLFEKQNKLLMNKIDDVLSKNNKIMKIHKSIKKLETNIPANTNLTISNQFIEKLIQKDKEI